MSMWNPWHGCHRYSEGCKYCYIHKGDAKRGVNTEEIVKTDNFYAPVAKTKKGEYKMKGGQTCYLCFSSDFLLEEADKWRAECWQMMRERQDINFLFLTKRIERFMSVVPDDWGDGYDNVTVCCTVENQDRADFRLPLFSQMPIKHKCITAQPLITDLEIETYLDGIELVVVGGESDRDARVLDYAWVLNIRNQCVRKNISFEFRQLGTHFLKDGKMYTVNPFNLCKQAKQAGINYQRVLSSKSE